MPTDIAGFIILGAIEQKWLAMGGTNGPVGLPMSNETATLDNVGRRQDFQYGVILWHPDTGAHEIFAPILDGWYSGSGLIGYPLNSVVVLGDDGRMQKFQNGAIYWHPNTGAHEVLGGFFQLWDELGLEKGLIGYPTGSEIELEDGGRMQGFQYGVIYWHPDTGAHEISDENLQLWSELGWETSVLGYPINSERDSPDGGRIQEFQHGIIYSHPENGVHEIYGAILQFWKELGRESSVLGYPISSEKDNSDGGRIQDFKNGTISWNSQRGAFIEVVRMRKEITTPSGTALGGWAELELRHNGDYVFRGHMHNSGLDPYRFRVRALISSKAGLVLALQQSGSVEGTLSSLNPQRDFNWEESNSIRLLRLEWSALQFSTFHVAKSYEDSGILGLLESFIIDLTEFFILKPLIGDQWAVILFVGKESGRITDSNLGGIGGIPGLVTAGVSRLIVGNGWAIPVFIGTYIATEVLVEYQVMTEEQYAFANLVFRGTLPPREKIMLTNLSGLDNRLFVSPNIDTGAVLNLGDKVYKDPMHAIAGSNYPSPGEVFIHELVHAWQLARSSFIPGYICKGIFSANYKPEEGQAWGDMNIEQQATVVNEWYRHATIGKSWSTLQDLEKLLTSEAAIRHKNFTYIHNHIRAAQN